MLYLTVGPSKSYIRAGDALTHDLIALEELVKQYRRTKVEFSQMQKRMVVVGIEELVNAKSGAFLTGLVWNVLQDLSQMLDRAFSVRIHFDGQDVEQIATTYAQACTVIALGFRRWGRGILQPNPCCTLEGVLPRDYQMAGVDAFGILPRGIWQCATNAGKTEMAAALVDRYPNARVLLTVPYTRSALAVQGKERFVARGIRHTGLVRSSPLVPHPVVWAASSTLIARYKKSPAKTLDWLNSFHIWIKDECHEHSSRERDMMMSTSIPFRLGMSGTPFTGNALEDAYTTGMHGAVIHQITNLDMVERGFSAKPYVYMINVHHTVDNPVLEAYAEWKSYITGLGWRNRLVVQIARLLAHHGYKVAVSCGDRERHAKPLAAMLSRLGATELYTGDQPIDQRKEVIKRYESGETKFLVATRVFDTGIDTNAVTGLILAGGSKKNTIQLQKMGRGLRMSTAKDHVVIVDLFDLIGFGKGQAHSRKNVWCADPAVTAFESDSFEAWISTFDNHVKTLHP